MKIIKTANGDKIKMSKSEWEDLGKKAGWMKEAQGFRGHDVNPYDLPDMDDPDWITTQLKSFVVDPESFWSNMVFLKGEPLRKAKDRKAFLKDMLLKLKNINPKLDMLSKPEQKSIASTILNLQEKEKEDEADDKYIEKLKQQDEVKEEGFLHRQEAPAAVAEPGSEEQAEEIPSIDNKMFANPRQIEEIKNQLLDSYIKKEITEDQLKMHLREFAKKHNLNIKLSKSDGRLQVKISKVSASQSKTVEEWQEALKEVPEEVEEKTQDLLGEVLNNLLQGRS